MTMKRSKLTMTNVTSRRGSTLVIVIALLGLLTFLGMVFFTFAAQERAAAEYFSEAAKAQYDEPNDVWPHMLEQIIVGAPEKYRGSILYSPTRRHSLVTNLVGSDIYPNNGDRIEVDYNGAGFPTITSTPTSDTGGVSYLNFVDSPAARGGLVPRSVPEPDVDYTYPDINNLFLAYKGWAIRQNGSGGFTQVPVIIPSFFRPQYMRTPANSAAGSYSLGAQKSFGADTAEVRTNPAWAYAYEAGTNPGDPPSAVDIRLANRDSVLFSQRSFRPNPLHIAGATPNGTVVRRYLTEDEATSLSIASGGFPFLPDDENNNGLRGDLGIWTASVDSSGVFDNDTYELDFDNDGDGIKEGIIIDLHFPVQEITDASGGVRKYVVLHSVTIYDLDGLFNLNVHGNLAGVPKTYQTTDALGNTITADHTLPTVAGQGFLTDNYVSRSHHGLGPNEVNPLWGLRRNSAIDADSEYQMQRHFGAVPTQTIQQANAEWIWLMLGRGDYDPSDGSFKDIIGGRWGDKNLLYTSLEKASPRLKVVELPRPGRAGGVYDTLSSGNISYGGRDGVDDNQNALEGEALVESTEVVRRPFGHPMSWSGVGRRTQVDYPVFNAATEQFEFGLGTQIFGADNPLLPALMRDTGSSGADQWPAYLQYGAGSTMSNTNPNRYVFGVDDTYNGTNAGVSAGGGDDLNLSPTFNELFEDPLETIFDTEKADRVRDGIAAIGDLIALQWPTSPTIAVASATDSISQHMVKLAPHAFNLNSRQREMFTTYSNTLRYIAMQRSSRRSWEYTADTDGSDGDDDGLPDGDGNLEFPPKFGTVDEFTAADPFRPQIRRILTNEDGESRNLIGALPISINHILDVDRTDQTPADGSVAFFRYMQRSGVRFRSLTEHPHFSQTTATASEIVLAATKVITLEVPGTSDADTNTVASEADVPFPPDTVAQQEFWARRDRQQLARDIYVLLYTLGGAEQVAGGNIRDYTSTNDPSAAVPTVLYTHAQLRRMAQFAVNMVDAMDNDNVITKFEYDKNLGNGWNLDDDAYSEEVTPSSDDGVTGKGMYPEDGFGTVGTVIVDRGVVFGVEAQELAFSEVLALVSPEIAAMDHDATLQDDTAGDRHHLFIELQNLLPNTMDLATSSSINEDTGVFRIARFDRDVISDPLANPDQPTAAITLRNHVDNTVQGGGVFTIATASDKNVVCSDFFVDYDLDGTYDLIAPDTLSGTLPTTGTAITDSTVPELKPRCDLDLLHDDHGTGRFTLTDDAQNVVATAGAFLSTLVEYKGNQPMIDLSANAPLAGGNFVATPGEDGFDLVIQRRLNPHMPSLANTAGQPATVDVNPWVEVDRIRVVFRNFGLLDSDTATEIDGLGGRLANIRSRERYEPLNDNTRTAFIFPTVNVDNRFNSIGNSYNVNNLQAPAEPFNASSNPVILRNLWQPHFDRDFASAGELLTLPVFGPNLMTQRLNYSRQAPYQQVQGSTPSPSNISGATAMFLWPDFDPTSNTSTEQDNRWYRLFQFVEVPSRVHRMLGNYVTQNRLPGKINLNMIRHFEVFAGLVDDPWFGDVDNARDSAPFLRDEASAGGRDRWREFIAERDGGAVGGYFDPTPGMPASGDEATLFHIPGVPGSQPFQSLGHQEDLPNDNGIEQTILRRLDVDETDGVPGTNRHWLEVGTSGNHTNPAASTTAVERHQILSKILNNTTTVSNTFIVFATAAYYEAYEDPATGFIRVGGRMDLDGTDDLNPGWQQRAVFVLDRTDAYNAFDKGSGDFDWERLVKHTTIIE